MPSAAKLRPSAPVHTAVTKEKPLVSQLTPIDSSDRAMGTSWPSSLDLIGLEVVCGCCPFFSLRYLKNLEMGVHSHQASSELHGKTHK